MCQYKYVPPTAAGEQKLRESLLLALHMWPGVSTSPHHFLWVTVYYKIPTLVSAKVFLNHGDKLGNTAYCILFLKISNMSKHKEELF